MKVICSSKKNAELVTKVLGSVFLSSNPNTKEMQYAQVLYPEDLIGTDLLEYIERSAQIPKEAVRTEEDFQVYGKNAGTRYLWTWYEIELGTED